MTAPKVLLLVAFSCSMGESIAAPAVSDREAIQKMIDSLGSEGGAVRLEAKTYVIDRAIVLRDKVTLRGAGVKRTVIRMKDGADPALIEGRFPWADRCVIRHEKIDENVTPEGNHDIAIRDLTIDGNAANNQNVGDGIFLACCYNYRIEDVHVKNCRGFGGIYTGPSHKAVNQRSSSIVDCTVEGQQAATDRDGAPYGHGIYITARDNDNVAIRGCLVRNNLGAGIHGEDNIRKFFLIDNECYGNKRDGIWLCEVSDAIVRGNKVYGNGHGIEISQAEGNQRNLIIDNEIHDNTYQGIFLSRQYGRGDSLCSILGNRIWNNGQDAILIDEFASGNTVGFNLCYDDRGKKAKQQRGVAVESGGNRIIHNYVSGNVNADLEVCTGNEVVEWKARIPLTEKTLLAGAGLGESRPVSEPDVGKKRVRELPATAGRAVIQRAIDSFGQQGGIVRLAAGTYVTDRAIVVRDNITLQGAGAGKTVIRRGDASDTPLLEGHMPFASRPLIRNEKYNEHTSPEGNHDITIRDLTLDGNAANNTTVGEGIFLSTCYEYHIQNVHIMNCRGFAALYTNPCHQARQKGIAYRNWIVDCVLERNQPALDRDAPYGHGLYLTATDNDNILVKGNVCRRNAGSGIHLEDYVENVLVEENECHDNRQYGIWLTAVSRCIVRNNLVHHNLRGVQVSLSKYTFVCGNDIRDNRLEGIYLGDWGFPPFRDSRSETAATFHVVAANVLRRNNRSYMDAGCGILVDTRFNTVAFNSIYDDTPANPTQFISILAYAPDNFFINNWSGPAAYYARDDSMVDMSSGENITVPFDGDEPLTLK